MLIVGTARIIAWVGDLTTADFGDRRQLPLYVNKS